MNKKFLINKNYYYFLISITIFFIHQIIYQPYVGFTVENFADFDMFMTHWVVGSIWFKKNFLSIPWFDPTRCMAIPFYPNPQNLYYSISQFFFIIFKPQTALHIYFLFLSFTAFAGTYLCLKEIFKCRMFVSILGSTIFLFNGFFNERFLVAHFGVVLYALVPLYIYLIFKVSQFTFKDKQKYIFLALSSFCLSQLVYGGAAALLPHTLLSIFLLIILIFFYNNNFKIFYDFAISFFIFICLSLSKITAGLTLLNLFPRQTHLDAFTDDSILNIFQIIISGLFFNSIKSAETLTVYNPDINQVNLHELNYFISITPLIIFVTFLILKTLKKEKLNLKFFKFNYFITTIFVLIIIFPILINYSQTYIFFSELPILKELWINSRFFLIYLLPIIFFSCLALNKLEIKYFRHIVLILLIITISQSYFYPKEKYLNRGFLGSTLDYNDREIIENISKPGYSIQQIVYVFDNNENTKNKSYIPLFYKLKENLSEHNCYEPIFGYELELKPRNKVFLSKNNQPIITDKRQYIYIDPYWKKDGHFNFANPVCQLFPKENKCSSISDNFKESEENKLTNLLKFKQFDFEKSKFQLISNYLSLTTFLILLILPLVIYILGFKSRD